MDRPWRWGVPCTFFSNLSLRKLMGKWLMSPKILKLINFSLRGQMGFDMIGHQNMFYGVFWKRGVRSASCFLPHQKILILAAVIAGKRSAPMSMCNSISIVRAIFIPVYGWSQKPIFQTSKSIFSYNFWAIILKLSGYFLGSI